jgi:pimeloyl-ACP methyl ester carboxylesterase
MFERRQLQLDGLRLAYLEQGSPTPGQPSLILLHGLMGCADTFLPLMQEFGPSQHILALDLPGSGGSERRDDIDPSLESISSHVGQFIEALHLDRPVLLGHSHGGAVGLRVAATAPATIRSLVLVSPAHPYFKEANPLIRFYLSLPGRLFAHTIPWFPQWMQMMGLRRMAGPKSWDNAARLKPYRNNLRTPGTMAHLLRLLRTWQADFDGLRRILRRPLATPSLVLWGDSDRAVPVYSANELRKHLLSSQMHVLEGVGHRPAEESPVAVARFVSAWIERGASAVMQPVLLKTVRRRHTYSANSSVSQARSTPLRTSSFEAGD